MGQLIGPLIKLFISKRQRAMGYCNGFWRGCGLNRHQLCDVRGVVTVLPGEGFPFRTLLVYLCKRRLIQGYL